MENTKRIREFINKRKDFLKANNIDVAYSDINNEWFVYYHDRQYHNFDFFIKFETVEQLIEIVLQEVEFRLRCAIEEECATPKCEVEDISDQIEVCGKKIAQTHDLEACIAFLEEKGLANDSMFFEGLKELLQRKIENRLK